MTQYIANILLREMHHYITDLMDFTKNNIFEHLFAYKFYIKANISVLLKNKTEKPHNIAAFKSTLSFSFASFHNH